MRVKIGDTWYDAAEGIPIAIEMLPGERNQLDQMDPSCSVYAQYPAEWTEDKAAAWISEGRAVCKPRAGNDTSRGCGPGKSSRVG